MDKKVKSFEHACEILERNPNALPDVSMLPEKDQKAFVSLYKITVIIEAQNKLDEFIVDWTNHNQYKYYPWLRVTKGDSGLGLSYSHYDFTSSVTAVGSRLVVKSASTAEYIFETFKELYESWHLI